MGAHAALRAAMSVCASILLAACGGGGGDSTSIKVQPGSLSFTATQSVPQTQNVTASFDGDGVVVGYPPDVEVPGWLSVAETLVGSSSVEFAVTVSAYGLSPGQYSTTLRFLTANVSQNGNISDITHDDVPVTLTVVNLSLAPESVSLEAVDGASAALPGTFTLQINASNAWTATSDQPWLTVDPSGTGPGDLDYVVNPAGLALGNHSGVVTVTGPGGIEATGRIELTVRAPLLSVDPAALTFTVDSANPALSQSLHISDELDGADAARASSWSVQSISASWLEMSPTSGSSAPSLDATVSVKSQSLATMANGNYTATITLAYTSTDDQQRTLDVPVTLQLDSPLQSLTVTPVNPERIVAQAPVQFTATGTYATGYVANVTTEVTWNSSSDAIADVSNTAGTEGSSRPLSPGAASVSAEMSGVSDSTNFTVLAAAGHAYTVSYEGNVVEQYVFAADGVLQPLSFHEAVATGSGPRAITFAPSGEYAYVSNRDSNSISQYTVSPGGYLVPMATPSVAAAAPFRLTVDPAGQYLYATQNTFSDTDVVSQFSIGSDGSLTPLTPPSVVSGMTPWDIGVLPTGGYAYVANRYAGVAVFSVGGDGTLTRTGTASNGEPVAIGFHPSGNAAYVVSQYGVSQYSVGADGTLAPMSPAFVDTGNSICDFIVVDGAGEHAYVIDTYGGTLRHFTIDAGGKLTATAAAAPATPYNPGGLALDPSGKYLYVLGRANNYIAQYEIDANGDVSEAIGTTPTSGLWGLVIRPVQ